LSGESLSHIDVLLQWYTKNTPGSIRRERLGLDGYSVLISVSGRRELKLLVTIYDPSRDGDFIKWVRSIMDSHTRAGISFDRIEVWVPEDSFKDLQEEVERRYESGEKWLSKVIVRNVSEITSNVKGIPSVSSETHVSKRAEPQIVSDRSPSSKPPLIVVGSEVHERKELKKREISVEKLVSELRSVIEDSLKPLIAKIEEKQIEVEILSRLSDLEKRVELLEAVIRLLGSQVPTNVMKVNRIEQPREGTIDVRRAITERKGSSKSEEVILDKREEGYAEVREQVNILNEDSSPRVPEDTQDILEEILNNPWVDILRKKGEDIEG